MKQETNLKIIISGPVGAGKSSAIASLSDIKPVVTDVKASDEVSQMKEATTVAMDYGTINLGEHTIHLYGTPGQQRFDFMWDILSEGALGLIVLIKHDSPDPVGDLKSYTDAFAHRLDSMPLCVGITHTDKKPAGSLNDYHEVVSRWGNVPVFTVDGRSKKDMNLLLMSLLGVIEPDIIKPLVSNL